MQRLSTYYCCERAVGTGRLICPDCAQHPYPKEPTMPRNFTPAVDCTHEDRKPIELKPVESSQIKAIGYDEDSQTLAVSFTRGPGNVYHYEGVQPDQAKAFMTADSLGSHFGEHIAKLPSKKYRPEPIQAAQA